MLALKENMKAEQSNEQSILVPYTKSLTPRTISSLPQDLPIAQLRTVHLNTLLQGDNAEAQKLFEACKIDSFFYLNIKDIYEHVLDVIDRIFEIDKELYDCSYEEKLLYDVDKISDFKLDGYKPVGRNFETNNLVTCHRPNEPFPDIIRLLKYHAQDISERGALHTPHTDLGSLTSLFTRQPGLQILAPDAEQWTWVEPRQDLRNRKFRRYVALLTNGYIKSCLHMVGPFPGQAMPERYSFAYLARAEIRTPMTGLKSPLIPAADNSREVLASGDWIKKKFGSLRLGSRKEEQDWVLTGQRKALPV
ncbi:hypothetical protein BDW69DRAFT_188832 [Aspergillus filifer]